MKKNVKVILAFALGFICSSTVAYAATIIASSEVLYDNSKSKLASTDVQGALDELYTKAEGCGSGDSDVSTSPILATYNFVAGTCETGDESACVKTTCSNKKISGSCPMGSIVKVQVNKSLAKTFHVLHDDGETITLIDHELTVPSVIWGSPSSKTAPNTVLNAIESIVIDWDNVNTINYSIGNASHSLGYSACSYANSCGKEDYILVKTNVKGRISTSIELYNLHEAYGRKGYWLNDSYHWTLSRSYGDYGKAYAWNKYNDGGPNSILDKNTERGARAVVEVSK